MKQVLLSLALLLSGVWLTAQNPDKAAELVDKGIKLHDKGDFEGAVGLYKKALEADVDNEVALAEIGLSLYSAHRFEEVIEFSERAVKKYPGSPTLETVYVTYGSALDELKRPKDALELYNEAIREFPEAFMLYFNKGITLVNMGRQDDALLSLQTAAKLNPRYPGIHNAIARILMLQDKRVLALLAYFRFFVVEPNSSRASQNLSAVQRLMNQGVEVTGKNKISINIDPKMLGDTLPDGSHKANNFGTIELLLSFTSALDTDKEHKKDTEREKFLRKLETICVGLSETQAKNTGFYWEFYAPYFIDMEQSKMIETFSYVVFASAEDAAVSKWIKANDDKIQAFYDWSNEFKWPE